MPCFKDAGEAACKLDVKDGRVVIPIDRFSPLRSCPDFDDAEAYHLKLVSGTFHPVGWAETDAENIDVYYIPQDEEEADSDWMMTRLPANLSNLATLLSEGFSQYTDKRDEDVLAEIEESLGSNDMYPSGSLELYRTDGYVPFFLIQRIVFFRKVDAVLISGGVFVDMNLDEHGVDFRLTANGIEFGHACEFYEDLLPEN